MVRVLVVQEGVGSPCLLISSCRRSYCVVVVRGDCDSRFCMNVFVQYDGIRYGDSESMMLKMAEDAGVISNDMTI